MSDSTSIPPHHGGGAATSASTVPPPPPPLQRRWAAHRELSSPPSMSLPASAAGRSNGAALTSPITALGSGAAPERSAVVTHRLSRTGGAVRSAALGGLSSARGRPEGPSRPGWDFTAGEDTELQQIAGDIPAATQHNPPPPPQRSTQAQAPPSGSSDGDDARAPPAAVPQFKAPPAGTSIAHTPLRQSSNSPTNGGSAAGPAAGGAPPTAAARQSLSPSGHVRSSPYESGSVSFLASATDGQLESFSGVNVVCRQRQQSPTNNLFFRTNYSAAAVAAAGNGVGGHPPAHSSTSHGSGGAWGLQAQQQQQPAPRVLAKSSESLCASGDGTFGPTTTGMAPAGTATSHAGGGHRCEGREGHPQGLAAPMPRQGPSQPSSAPAPAVPMSIKATVAHHHNPNAAAPAQVRGGGGRHVDTTHRSETHSHALLPGEVRGHTQMATATTTTTNNNRSTLSMTAAVVASAGANPHLRHHHHHHQQQQQQQPPHHPKQWSTLPAAAAVAVAGGQHANTPPVDGLSAAMAGLSRRTNASDSPAPSLATLPKRFTESERLAALAEVQRGEQHLAYPSVHIPEECLNHGDTEANARRLEQRRKQIAYGKDTDGYRTYIRVVPHAALREFHNPLHPITPRPENDCSKRAFDRHLNMWRRQLHQWDACDAAAPDAAFRPLGVATLGELGLAERMVTPVSRPPSSTGLLIHHHHHHHHLHGPQVATMQSIASLATPAAAVGADGPSASTGIATAAQGAKAGLRLLHSPAAAGPGQITSLGSFRCENGNSSNSNSMATPINHMFGGTGRPSSAADCQSPSITFDFQRVGGMNSGHTGSVSVNASAMGSSVTGNAGTASGPSPRGYAIAATSTPNRPQSVEGPELDCNFFNASGVMMGGAGEGVVYLAAGMGGGAGGRGSALSSPLGMGVPQLDIGQQQQQQQGSPLARATPFGGVHRTPAHNRPNSTSRADRSPASGGHPAAHHPLPGASAAGAGGGVMSRLLDFHFDLMTESTRASPAGQQGFSGGYNSTNGLMPLPTHWSPYRRSDSGGAGLIPNTVVAPPQPHPQRQPPPPPPTTNTATVATHTLTSHATPPHRGYPELNYPHYLHHQQHQQQPVAKNAAAPAGRHDSNEHSSSGQKTLQYRLPGVHLTAGPQHRQ